MCREGDSPLRLAEVKPIPSLFTIAPANRDHEVGLRCAFSVFVPLIPLLVLDRVNLAVFASFGAFTAIYGRNQPHGLRLRSQLRGGGLMVAVWYVIAAGVAGVLATLLGPVLGIRHSYWAMVAAVVPLVGHSTRYRVNRGLQPIIGTFLGLGVLAVVLWLDPPLWAVVVLIALLQLLAEMYIARQYVLAQMAVTPLALLSTVLASAGAAAKAGVPGLGVDRGALIYDRAVETVIGAVVGMVSVLYPWAWRTWVRRSPDPARELP